MKLFSHRKGLKKVRTEIQVGSMDDALRNCLWNMLMGFYWKTMTSDWISASSNMKVLFTRLWNNYFKKPLDTLDDYWSDTYEEIREIFFKYKWHEVYDFIEFVANNYPDEERNEKFMEACNHCLEREMSVYRFVGGLVTEITSEVEISEIEEALETPFKTVNTHLENALKLMSDRESPDYRNSIKESISAVEAIFRLITKNDKVTLGQALRVVETKIGLHGALKKAFSNLYGYTSTAEGIRHALMDDPKLSFEDAKFMLVSCSAFVNYLTSKAEKAKVKL